MEQKFYLHIYKGKTMTKEINIDEKINQLFEVVKKQREEVAKSEKEIQEPWKTNCSISLGTKNPQNIQVMQEESIKQIVVELLIAQDYFEPLRPEGRRFLYHRTQPK